MRQSARDARAEEIERAAYGVLEAKGYDGLSMLAVARAAKASNETLYRWYGDKLGLFRALIERNTGVVAEALDRLEAEGASDELERLGEVLLAMLLGPRAVALNRAAAADGSGILGQALAAAGRGTVRPWIAEVMRRKVEAGRLAGEPGEMAETWFALLIGDMQVRMVTGAMTAPAPDAIAERASAALEKLRRLYPVG